MDRRVKERLVGASILMLLIVLIVPELLSGPKSGRPSRSALPTRAAEPVRNVTVDLATSKPPLAAPVTEASDGASAAAPPATAPPAAAPPAAAPLTREPPAMAPAATAAPGVTTLPAAVPSAPLETAAAVPISKHAWAVQLGSFANRANADKLAHQLKSQGFAAYVSSSGSRAAVRYRVRMGPLSDRAAAGQALAKLKASGRNASIVPPAR